MSEPKFKRGDVVQHRASGEKAVVVALLMRCINVDHQLSGLTHFGGFRADCILEFSGNYQLDPGFQKEVIEYSEDFLESVS